MVGPYLRYTLGGLIVAMLVLIPLSYAAYKKNHTRNFRVVSEGVLYRSGQMSMAGFKKTVKDFRIKTVVTLRSARNPGEPHPDRIEEEFCAKEQIKYVRIPYKEWNIGVDGQAPVDESLRQFYQVMKDPKNHPVLVHCFAGKHRTGAYCAVYRMEFEGWSSDAAIAEMAANGYDNIEDHHDVVGFMTRYQPGRVADGAKTANCAEECRKGEH